MRFRVTHNGVQSAVKEVTLKEKRFLFGDACDLSGGCNRQYSNAERFVCTSEAPVSRWTTPETTLRRETVGRASDQHGSGGDGCLAPSHSETNVIRRNTRAPEARSLFFPIYGTP